MTDPTFASLHDGAVPIPFILLQSTTVIEPPSSIIFQTMKPIAIIFILFTSFASFSLAGQGYSAPQPESASSSGASPSEKTPLIPKEQAEETPAQAQESSGEQGNLRPQSPQTSGDGAENPQEESPLPEEEAREKSSFLTCSSGLVFALMLALAIE
ncbi:hypothetical protein MACJ_001423 [Theileria orientalis]|uniref:Uncharacterized protein n=1 Tax=Theileria orientalis TaxID=68886 RepID=A0A976QRI5_THEOR|nr:hypothetical protein MACJ_001423 [Theileria orientalis]